MRSDINALSFDQIDRAAHTTARNVFGQTLGEFIAEINDSLILQRAMTLDLDPEEFVIVFSGAKAVAFTQLALIITRAYEIAGWNIEDKSGNRKYYYELRFSPKER